MRARLRRSESIEKAAVSDCQACGFYSHWSCVKQPIIPLLSLLCWIFTNTFVELLLTFLDLQEAAALVSQRSVNPREFFRQLSSSSSLSPTSPGSSRGGTATPAHGNNYLFIYFLRFNSSAAFSAGRPFRRYQRSLTDTAFIFSKAEEARPPSPRSSPLVSPFSRTPPSPIFRATSPPASPNFRPVTSTQRPRAPVSPPASPSRPSPPASALPEVPRSNDQTQTVSEAKSPTEPSAPPASPTVLASLSSSLLMDNPASSHPEVLLDLPSNAPVQSEGSSFCFEPVVAPQAPTVPLPERPNPGEAMILIVRSKQFRLCFFTTSRHYIILCQ